MHQNRPAILWFRQDLRLENNPALNAAANHPVIAIYILDEEDPWKPGAASRWWLYESLKSLKRSLNDKGVSLIFKQGNPLKILTDLTETTHAQALYWNRCYEPYTIRRDQSIKTTFKDKNIICESFNASLLAEPWELQTKSGNGYRLFAPFWKTLQDFVQPNFSPSPTLKGWKGTLQSDQLEDWNLDPFLWGEGLKQKWSPGEKEAHKKVKKFLHTFVDEYSQKRDYPYQNNTSSLSPHLHWGEISPVYLWREALLSHGPEALPFLRQLAWRDFSYHLLYHFPQIPLSPMNPAFSSFSWEPNPDFLQAWQKGQTGYPLVDAGMRELWHTGWMHNRVRMVTASFLVKDLLIPWQKGQEWFWDTLVDADLANNSVSWQWVAGCGIDAAPYFRIFNSSLQSQKFDPLGMYIKTWVPELQNLQTPYLHAPWTASADVLRKAGVSLGVDYPFPIIDHNFARKRALSAFHSLGKNIKE